MIFKIALRGGSIEGLVAPLSVLLGRNFLSMGEYRAPRLLRRAYGIVLRVRATPGQVRDQSRAMADMSVPEAQLLTDKRSCRLCLIASVLL